MPFTVWQFMQVTAPAVMYAMRKPYVLHADYSEDDAGTKYATLGTRYGNDWVYTKIGWSMYEEHRLTSEASRIVFVKHLLERGIESLDEHFRNMGVVPIPNVAQELEDDSIVDVDFSE